MRSGDVFYSNGLMSILCVQEIGPEYVVWASIVDGNRISINKEYFTPIVLEQRWKKNGFVRVG